MKKNHSWLMTAAGLVATGTIWAGGFEDRPVLWSGKHAGTGGAAVSSVAGSESLLFNPAGLANEENDASVNYTPTWSQTKAPTIIDSKSDTSKRLLTHPIGLTAKYTLSPDLSVGAGFFVAAGVTTDYGASDFSRIAALAAAPSVAALKPDYGSTVAVLEAALGAAYRLAPGLKIGASWRASYVKAEFKLPSITNDGSSNALSPQVIAAISLTDLSASNYAGFRLGAQYAPEGLPYGVGVAVRTPVKFKAEGDMNTKAVIGLTSSSVVTYDATTVTVENQLPLEIAVGGHFDATPELRILAEYDYFAYAKNKVLDFNGTSTKAGVPVSIAMPDVTQNWKNQNTFRLGAEYKVEEGTVLRAGYVLSTAVTPKTYAKPVFPTPGSTYSFALGGGQSFMEGALDLNAAVEYAFSSAKVEQQTGIFNGDYSTNVYALHLGAAYRF